MKQPSTAMERQTQGRANGCATAAFVLRIESSFTVSTKGFDPARKCRMLNCREELFMLGLCPHHWDWLNGR